MKTLLLYFIFFTLATISTAQEPMTKIMEQRAREMARVIGLSEKDAWRKFITENYTQTLIDKPMRVSVQDGTKESPSAKTTHEDNLEGKVNMFQRLHNDFGGSKIMSIKSTEENLTMVLDNGDGFQGTFKLKFEKKSPYLIDGVGVQAGR